MLITQACIRHCYGQFGLALENISTKFKIHKSLNKLVFFFQVEMLPFLFSN